MGGALLSSTIFLSYFFCQVSLQTTSALKRSVLHRYVLAVEIADLHGTLPEFAVVLQISITLAVQPVMRLAAKITVYRSSGPIMAP